MIGERRRQIKRRGSDEFTEEQDTVSHVVDPLKKTGRTDPVEGRRHVGVKRHRESRALQDDDIKGIRPYDK